jgi:hypothetical protein
MRRPRLIDALLLKDVVYEHDNYELPAVLLYVETTKQDDTELL